MGRAKEIIVKVIPAKIANEFVKKHHYSGKVVNTSKIHFGCFLDNKLHGVLSYGDSMMKRKTIHLVEKDNKPVAWNDYLELNRMAFDDYLPKNSESRCIAISIKLIKRNAPNIKWVLSYSDASLCGDGTIYRASGFYLTQIRPTKEMWIMPNGEVIFEFAADIKYKLENNGRCNGGDVLSKKGGRRVENGYQNRYIYLIDKTCKITVPVLPFSKIDEMGAGMYKGKKVSLQERKQAAIAHLGEHSVTCREGAFDATVPLKLQRNNSECRILKT